MVEFSRRWSSWGRGWRGMVEVGLTIGDDGIGLGCGDGGGKVGY